MRKIKFIIVHWSVTGKSTTVEDLRNSHLKRKFRDIGYHRVILYPSPVQKEEDEWWQLVKKGRDLNDDIYLELNEIGAHTLGYNKNSVGICLIGHPLYEPDPLQLKALQKACLILARRFNVNPDNIIPHNKVNATLCPGTHITEHLELVKKYCKENIVPF